MELNFSTDDGNAAAPVLAGATMGAGDPPPPPPSSVHGEVDEDDQLLGVEDSFHEDDNMNAEEGNIPLADNLRSDSMNAVTDDETGVSTHPAVVPTPQQPELTLKEKLVLRERQRRIETERARLKRQFALSAASNDESVEMIDGETPRTGHHLDLDVTAEDALSNVNDQEFEEESTRAHPDEEEAAADEANRRLGFNMERFLRNSDSFHPGEFEAEDSRVLDVSATTETKGVVMERFLNELVENASRIPLNNDEAFGVVGRSNDAATGVPLSEPHRSVSFDVDAMTAAPTGDNSQLRNNYPQVAVLTLTHPSSFGEESGAGMSLASNASLRTEANTAREDIFSVGDPPQYSSASVDVMQETDDVSQGQISSHVSDDEPRVLRLTEADMLEMAAIEEASIGNAPPSDRDDVESYSEIGEMTDFGGSGAAMNRFLGDATFTSPDTPTTAMDSASQISHRSAHRGGTSAVSSSSATNEHLEVEHVSDPLGIIESILSTTDATQYFIAPASASVAANPPSDRDHDDDDVDVGSHLNDLGDDDEPMDQFPFDDKFVLDDAGIANTTNRQRRYIRTDHNSLTDSLDDHVQGDNLVDGFDFDKDAPQSPFLERPVRGSLSNDDSFRNLPVDPWSPQGQMNISPLLVGDGPMAVTTSENGSKPPDMPLPTHHTNYGTSSNIGISSISLTHATLDGETMPLLHSSSIPPEIITRKEFSKPENPNDSEGLRATDRRSQFQRERFSWFRSSDRVSIRSVVESVFSDVRSEDDADKALLHSESEVYLAGNILARAFPERQIALLATMMLEIPVLLMITGGSDALCELIGRSRYHLLLGFLPLTSAISGNVGLQASTLTTRAISHSHVTVDSYQPWFIRELGVSACLGFGMGMVLGTIAYVSSGYDLAFGVTIMIAQFVSVVAAGITGTLAPLVFTFVFKRDAGKWSGPLETAIQDIVGSFAIVVLSYHILVLLSSGEVDPSDQCVIVNAAS